MSACASDLSTRSDQADLPLVPNGKTRSPPVGLLSAEAHEDTWRIIEAYSRPGLPFELQLWWSSGAGNGATAKVTVANATRICVLARSLRIEAVNLSPVVNRVGVNVADGFAPTANQYEAQGTVVEGNAFDAAVPPFATSCRVEVGDLSVVADTAIHVVDAMGQIRGAYNAAIQPFTSGIPVGGASLVRVSHNQPATRVRVVFTLSL